MTVHNASSIDRCWGHVLGLQQRITVFLASDTIHCIRITKYHKFIMTQKGMSLVAYHSYRRHTFHLQEYFTKQIACEA